MTLVTQAPGTIPTREGAWSTYSGSVLMSNRALANLRNVTLFVIACAGIYLVFGKLINKFWRWITMDRSPDWWGASGQWAGAIGTIAAVVVALGIAIRDNKKGREERLAHAEEEKRRHISQLSSWVISHRPTAGITFPLKLLNTSREPFYNVVVFPVFIQGAAPHTGEQWLLHDDEGEYGQRFCAVIGVLPPGRWEIDMEFDTGVMQGRAGVEIAGTDRLGNHWVRRATGNLEEISLDPVNHYGILRPINYRTPKQD
jgi:hypothetical protein